MQLSRTMYVGSGDIIHAFKGTPQNEKNKLFDSPCNESTGLIVIQRQSPFPTSKKTYDNTPQKNIRMIASDKFVIRSSLNIEDDEETFETQLCEDVEYYADQYFLLERSPIVPSKNVPDLFGFYKDELSGNLYISDQFESESNMLFWRNWTKHQDTDIESLRSRIYFQGIAHSERSKVWSILMNVEDLRESYKDIHYHDLVGHGAHPIHGKQISLDLHRTFSNHYIFASKDRVGQLMLSNVLNAYAYFNESVGYCQGMGFLVGMLLMMNMKEEDTFWNFVALMERTEIENYFEPSMSGIIKDTKLLNEILRIDQEELYQYFANYAVDCTLFTSRWLLQLYTDLPDWRTVLHMWDVIMLERKEGIFRVSLAILKSISDSVMDLNSTEDIFGYLLKIPLDKIEWCTLIPHLNSNIKRILTQCSNAELESTVPSTPQRSVLKSLWGRFRNTKRSNLLSVPKMKNKRLSPLGRSVLRKQNNRQKLETQWQGFNDLLLDTSEHDAFSSFSLNLNERNAEEFANNFALSPFKS